ncbi:MAG TPA: DUF4390 domain-containing protein [Candidatus Deferrimicrobiaceae bacterium]|jgi:hypothetical protein|nr:DUF4390 domain-containing protein [Candidatus Deferrimicrobiaceae bacterium]
MGTRRRRPIGSVALVASLLAAVLLGAGGAAAQVRVSNLAVFLNDYDVTVTVVLFGAVPSALHESIHTGIAAHVRYYVELWQHTPLGIDRRLQARTVERQITYNVLTKEYKVASLKGEQREPMLTKDLREAQRVISELRVGQLAPVAALDKRELYYVRVRSDVSLGGVNSWFARMTGEAEETPWVQSSLLTPVRGQ